MAITWGQNTVHPIPGAPSTSATPAAPAFGSTPAPPPPPPAAAPTGGSLFGTPTPAPAPTGSLFGTTTAFGTPAPSPGTSLFGGTTTTSPAPATTSLFGGTPTPAPGTSSLFGGGGAFGTPTPAPTTFGFGTPTPAPSAFGSSAFGQTQQQQQPQQPQIPAQAALQAHMDASARQEAERVRSALQGLHIAYSGGSVPTANANDNSKFVAIVYNDLTPEQRQQQWLQGMGRGGSSGYITMAPPRPAGVSAKEWEKAVVNNPDPENYMPQALIGGVALQARVAWQQGSANELAKSCSSVQKALSTVKDRSTRAKQDIEEKARRHAVLRKRLLDLMRRVELARGMNQPIQMDEINILRRLKGLLMEVESVRGSLTSLQDKARTQTAVVARSMEAAGIPDKAQLLPVLKEQRQKLEKLTLTTKHDVRDVQLIHGRTIDRVPARI